MNEQQKLLSYNWHHSIDEIDRKSWEAIFNSNILKGFDFFKAQCEANIEGANFMFLTVSIESTIFALIPCFTYRLRLDVIASPSLRKFSNTIKKQFPNFLSVKIFGVGSLASTCEQHIGIVEGLDENLYRSVCRCISEQIKIKSRELKTKLVFVKEVPESQLSYIKDILSSGYYFYDSLPASIIPLFQEVLPYPSGLKHKERYRYRVLKHRFEEFYHWEKVKDFSALTKEFEWYYLATLSKSPNQFEAMNESFFRNINEFFKENSYLLIAKDKKDVVHAIGLVIEDETSLIPIYLGLNYENGEKELKLLHTNSMFRAIEEAEKSNKHLVMLGQTSYYSKALCGALVQKLYLGFYSYNSVLQYIIKHFFGKLFTPSFLTPNTYKSSIEIIIKEKMNKLGFTIEN